MWYVLLCGVVGGVVGVIRTVVWCGSGVVGVICTVLWCGRWCSWCDTCCTVVWYVL